MRQLVAELHYLRQKHTVEATLVSLKEVRGSCQWLQYSFVLIQEVEFIMFQSRQHQSVTHCWELACKLQQSTDVIWTVSWRMNAI